MKMINKLRRDYPRNRDISLIVALVLCTVAARLAAELDAFAPAFDDSVIPAVMVEHVPVTLQGKRKPPPPRPAVPVPSDNDEIPAEETIEPIDLDYYADNGADGGAGIGDVGIGGPTQVPPRPIAWVIPEYPKKVRKKGIKGEVKVSIEIDVTGRVIDAVVIENTTGSELCAQSAIKAALASRFIPARENGKPKKDWLIMPYRFDLSK